MNLQPTSTPRLPAAHPVIPRLRRPRLPLAARVMRHRWRLDQQLSRGYAPDASDEHSRRARQLLDPVNRRRVARSLRRVVAEATRPPRPRFSSAIPADRTAVLRWRQALLVAAARLEQPVPISPQAIARLLILLRDGNGPLYNGAVGDSTLALALAGFATADQQG